LLFLNLLSILYLISIFFASFCEAFLLAFSSLAFFFSFFLSSALSSSFVIEQEDYRFANLSSSLGRLRPFVGASAPLNASQQAGRAS